MAVLAKAPPRRLAALWQALPDKPGYQPVRPPEIGMVMVRGRAGGTGSPFNLGEMTVTRCVVRLDTAPESLGHATVAGRDKAKAETAAVLDAMLQTDADAARVRTAVIEPLAQEQRDRARARAAKVAKTKVDFYTMVRGED